MKRPINLVEIESLEYRMNNPMTLDEADRFNAELFKKNFTDDNDNPNYDFSSDELMEYVRLSPKKTGLPMDCLAADGVESWKYRNHDMWFLMRNGYSMDDFEFIPFTVEDNPKMVGTYDLKVSQNDVNNVIGFIIRNLGGLLALGNGDIRNDVFLKNIDTTQYRMAEGVEHINEMGKLFSDETGLPTDIWVDELKTYAKGGHAPRLKFNAIQGNHDSNRYSTMTLHDEPPVSKYVPNKTFLKEKEISEIKKFVRNNRELLLRLADGEIDINEFRAKMIKNTK